MALPSAVQKQLDQVEQFDKEMAGVAVVSQTDPVVEPPKAAEPAAEVIPPAPVPEVRTPDWEQKYRTIQGKYDAEVPRLHAQVREMTHSMQAVQQQLEELKRAPAPEPVKASNESLVTEQDKEAFGEDLVNLQERIARSVAAPLEAHIQKLTERLGKYEGTAEVTAAQQAASAEDRYFERLAARTPNWEQINTDPKWVEWLTGRYPGSTQTRQEQLNVARANLDLNATAEMFEAYESANKITEPEKPANRSQELNSQVAPAKSKSSSTAVTDTKRIWTPAEVAAALDPRKLRQMTATEVEHIMSEIDAASAEGRVR